MSNVNPKIRGIAIAGRAMSALIGHWGAALEPATTPTLLSALLRRMGQEIGELQRTLNERRHSQIDDSELTGVVVGAMASAYQILGERAYKLKYAELLGSLLVEDAGIVLAADDLIERGSVSSRELRVLASLVGPVLSFTYMRDPAEVLHELHAVVKDRAVRAATRVGLTSDEDVLELMSMGCAILGEIYRESSASTIAYLTTLEAEHRRQLAVQGLPLDDVVNRFDQIYQSLTDMKR